MPRRTQFLAISLAVLCAVISRGEPPPLIPREVLFGNPERSLPQISPDGARLAWLAPDKNGMLNVWVGSIAAADARPVTNETHRPIQWYSWAGDSQHILYLQDNNGDEIDHLFSTDLNADIVRDLTPFRGVRAQNVLVDLPHPKVVLVALNLRDRHAFDMHRVDLETGAMTLEAANPGDVLSWMTDNDFVIRAATAFDGKSGASIIRVRDAADKPWRDLVTMPFERALFGGEVVDGSLVAGFDSDNRNPIIHSALNSDKGRLVRVDFNTGKELNVVAEDPQSDVADFGDKVQPVVVRHPVTHVIEAVQFNYMVRRWTFLDPKMKADFEILEHGIPDYEKVSSAAGARLDLISRDRADQKWILAMKQSGEPATYYSFDRQTKNIMRLFEERPALTKFTLAPKKPVIIKSRDGLDLVSYLTTPPGAKPEKLPLVLSIHGGPWSRDNDDYEDEVQLLANRGYAVLQVNYRGSVGLGLKFFNAGTNEWGRGTQQDLFDAVQWAINQQIIDPKRIAAMGWSGGGFATLRCLEMKPELFACGVDGVGPADLATLYRSFPSYWSNILARWRRRGGDFDHDEKLNYEVSPLYSVDGIKAPLLIGQGQNDPRVTIANADGMVTALRKAKREVLYVVYPDEGHGFYRPENNMDFYGRLEEFLAKHLGGRAEPWKKIAGATAELR